MSSKRYKDPPGIDSIQVGSDFEKLICARFKLRPVHNKDEQIHHGDACSKEGVYYEIKHDPHSQYRHLMIEVAACPRGDGHWHLGGVFADSDAHWYIQGDEAAAWMFDRPSLKEWLQGKGITPETVMQHIGGKTHAALKNFQDTMLRVQMEYIEANRIGRPIRHLHVS